MSGAASADDWVKSAMKDDSMVVELLFHLHESVPPPRHPPPLPAVPLEWSVRQRRSRPVSVTNSQKKHSQRASPTTPLSWSGATSVSGGSGGSGAAGYEESSLPDIQKISAAATRSKVNAEGEKSSSKRSRKKKTLAELKDEESTLIKERRDLKREIAAWRMNVEKLRVANENLKRIKIESVEEKTTSSDQPIPPPVSENGAFVLPDLNMPFEEGCGVS